MDLNVSTQRYGAIAQTFHWTIVVLIIVQVTLALLADDLPRGAEKLALMMRHKSFGITILALVVLRLVWRLLNRPPPLPPMPRWQQIAAQVSHWGMYALLLAIPLAGWMMSSSAGRPVNWFGLFQLPDLVGQSESLGDVMHELHEILAKVLLAVIGVHVAAALKHHFWDGHGLLWRMLPFKRGS